jgi:transcription antitermination factor NusG
MPKPIKLFLMKHLWYALHVKPHKESTVYDLLQAKGIDAFYPRLKVKPVNPRSRKERPFFPGYLFVNLDLDEAGASILHWTEGTYGLIEFGGEPATVPENMIEELKRRLDHLQSHDDQLNNFSKGDKVRVVEGAFEGYEGVFDLNLPDKDRVQVLMTYLRDQPKKLQINSSYLKKI